MRPPSAIAAFSTGIHLILGGKIKTPTTPSSRICSANVCALSTPSDRRLPKSSRNCAGVVPLQSCDTLDKAVARSRFCSASRRRRPACPRLFQLRPVQQLRAPRPRLQRVVNQWRGLTGLPLPSSAAEPVNHLYPSSRSTAASVPRCLILSRVWGGSEWPSASASTNGFSSPPHPRGRRPRHGLLRLGHRGTRTIPFSLAVVGRQAGWALAGVLLMVALMSIDYEHYNSPRFIFTASPSQPCCSSSFSSSATPNTRIAGYFSAASPSSRLKSQNLCLFCFWRGSYRNALTPSATCATRCCAPPSCRRFYSAHREAARPRHRSRSRRRHRR